MAVEIFLILLFGFGYASSFEQSDCFQVANCTCETDNFPRIKFACSYDYGIVSLEVFKRAFVMIDCRDLTNIQKVDFYNELPQLDESYYTKEIALDVEQCALPNKFSTISAKYPSVWKAHFFSYLPNNNIGQDFFDIDSPLTDFLFQTTSLSSNFTILRNLKNLESVHINTGSVPLESLPSKLFEENVKLRNCTMIITGFGTTIPVQLFHLNDALENVFFLFSPDKMANEFILSIDDRLFSNKINLVTVKLKGHSLTAAPAPPDHIFRDSTNLGTIWLKKMGLTNLRGELFEGLEKLRYISLEGNLIKALTWTADYSKIEFIDLTFNLINELEIISPDLVTPNTTFDLRRLKSSSMTLTYRNIKPDDYYRLLLNENKFGCDLSLHFLYYSQESETRQIHLNMGNAKCSKPDRIRGCSLKDITRKDLMCTTIKYFANCTCFYQDDKSLKVDCSSFALASPPDLNEHQIITTGILDVKEVHLNFNNNSLSRLPDIPRKYKFRITEIFARYNSIQSVTVDNLGADLKRLDLRNNSLKFLTPDFLDQLKSLQQVWLGFNPFNCSCSTVDFISKLKTLESVVVDYKDLECENLNKKFIDSWMFEICFDWSLVAGICFFLASLGVSIALYYKFKKDIKIFLYAHNMCLWFTSEEELDEDKIYDAFVCFASPDQSLVEDIIIELESPPDDFKILVGVRDWPIGNMLSELIRNSIEQSLRTIVFLSSDFLKSHWCRHEFRAAQTEASAEGRNRIIVITYGDVEATDEMDEELKSYLRMHLYIKYEDRRFMQKLRYAMPHRTNAMSNKTNIDRQTHETMPLRHRF